MTGDTAHPLKQEFDYYLAHQSEFVDQYDGKVVVIKGSSW